MRLQNYIYVTTLVLVTCCVSLSAQTFQNLSSVSGTLNQGLFSTNLAWGDYDGDGFLDLYCTNWGTAVTNPINALYQNQGDETFINTAAIAGVDNNGNSMSAAFADYTTTGIWIFTLPIFTPKISCIRTKVMEHLTKLDAVVVWST